MNGQRDFASSAASVASVWGPGVLLLILTYPLGWWARTIGWTVGLVWLSGLCLWNFYRCRRVHCMFTGPFFLAMAAITLLVGFRVVSLGASTWGALADVVLIGGILLWLGPELVLGRYWRHAE